MCPNGSLEIFAMTWICIDDDRMGVDNIKKYLLYIQVSFERSAANLESHCLLR
jgi:hypothetical protein